jgi:hypothetical protein
MLESYPLEEAIRVSATSLRKRADTVANRTSISY